MQAHAPGQPDPILAARPLTMADFEISELIARGVGRERNQSISVLRYTFVETALDVKQKTWLRAHTAMFDC